jgi:hypothetical protein
MAVPNYRSLPRAGQETRSKLNRKGGAQHQDVKDRMTEPSSRESDAERKELEGAFLGRGGLQDQRAGRSRGRGRHSHPDCSLSRVT